MHHVTLASLQEKVLLLQSSTTHKGNESSDIIASFPGPAQLPVACSTVKRERAWYTSSRE